MIVNRRAHGAKENAALREVTARKKEGNLDWLARTKADGALILLGGTSLADFRIRVAQSHVRRDLLPSFWSLAGIVVGPGKLATVPLEDIPDAGAVTRNNGVVEVPLRRFDDPGEWPNIAVLQFASGVTASQVDSVRRDRSIVDIPSLMIKWLAFAWGADAVGNPLLASQGLPSAAFVGSAYALARIDLTPGLASASTCPEAIWQSVKWWREFYEKTAGPPTADPASRDGAAPRGKYALRQMAAAVVG
jgi:hypothetical protein